jgi:uncharacterized protein (DUF58 family)
MARATPKLLDYVAIAPTPVHRRPGFDFSLTGLVYCAIMMFMGFAAVNLQASLLFGVFGLMIGILGVSGWISGRVLRRLELRRLLPDQGTVGRPTLVNYYITNKKRIWASFSVTVSEIDGVQGFRRQPHAYLLHVAPRGTAAINCEVVPKRRGIVELNRYQLSTSFPFGFIKRAIVAQQPDTLLIFPPLAVVDPKLLTQFRSAESIGNNLRAKLRGTDEFYGLREYRPGESPRMIYWKRSARTGVLVMREMTQVAPPRIIVVVDTFNPDGSFDRAVQIEKSIAQASSLVEAASEAGLAVGFTARGEHWHIIEAKRGKRHKRELQTLLAKLPVGTAQRVDDAHTALAQAAVIANNLTTFVLMTGGTDSSVTSTSRRGAGIIIGCDSDMAKENFQFDPGVDFRTVGPMEPALTPGRIRRGWFVSFPQASAALGSLVGKR